MPPGHTSSQLDTLNEAILRLANVPRHNSARGTVTLHRHTQHLRPALFGTLFRRRTLSISFLRVELARSRQSFTALIVHGVTIWVTIG